MVVQGRPLLTTFYPCRQGSPDTPFRVRRDKRVLDRSARRSHSITDRHIGESVSRARR
jgi:hypothetical protein